MSKVHSNSNKEVSRHKKTQLLIGCAAVSKKLIGRSSKNSKFFRRSQFKVDPPLFDSVVETRIVCPMIIFGLSVYGESIKRFTAFL